MTESPVSAVRVASLVALLSMMSMFATLHAAPPTQNLSVQVRIVDDSVQASMDARAGAVVTRGSSGQANTSGAVVVQSGTRRHGAGLQHQVLVLNGGRATLQPGAGHAGGRHRSLPGPPGARRAAVRSQWVELVNGMEVSRAGRAAMRRSRWKSPCRAPATATADSGQPLPPQVSVFTTRAGADGRMGRGGAAAGPAVPGRVGAGGQRLRRRDLVALSAACRCVSACR